MTSGAPPPPEDVTAVGFLLGGYDEGGIGEAWEVGIPNNLVDLIATTATRGGAATRGQTEVVRRLLKGIDAELLGDLASRSDKLLHLEALAEEIEALGYIIPFESMNLQDAIDFAVLLFRTTIDIQRQTLGTHAVDDFYWPGVGGPIEIATVDAFDGFTWIQQTSVQGERPPGQAEGSQ